MDALTQTQGAAMFGDGASAQISYQQYQMLQTLRRLSDQASYYWQKTSSVMIRTNKLARC